MYLIQTYHSCGTIDYAGASSGHYESALFESMLEAIRNTIAFSARSSLYRISDDTIRLVQTMVNECQVIEPNKGSIIIRQLYE